MDEDKWIAVSDNWGPIIECKEYCTWIRKTYFQKNKKRKRGNKVVQTRVCMNNEQEINTNFVFSCH